MKYLISYSGWSDKKKRYVITSDWRPGSWTPNSKYAQRWASREAARKWIKARKWTPAVKIGIKIEEVEK